jgi:hypothetical protein
VLFTSLPVVLLGSLDQDVLPARSIRFPGLYYPGQAKLWFSRRVFSNFAIHGLVTSLVLVGFILGNQPRQMHDAATIVCHPILHVVARRTHLNY